MTKRLRTWWKSGPTSKRWERAMKLGYLPTWLGGMLPLWPDPVRFASFAVAFVILIMTARGYQRARRREGHPPLDIAGSWRRGRAHLRAVFRRGDRP